MSSIVTRPILRARRRRRRITPDDSKSVIVLGRRLLTGINRLKGHDDRHKQYSTELVLTDLEEIELKLVYFLEDAGFPSITVPPVHFDPRHYDAKGDTRGPLSLAHAAVEAGLGTLGLNLMLLTPEYGPRVHARRRAHELRARGRSAARRGALSRRDVRALPPRLPRRRDRPVDARQGALRPARVTLRVHAT